MLAALGLLAACGGGAHAAPPAATAVVLVETSAGEPTPVGPTELEILVDGVRDGILLDERDGRQLVAGAGTIALIDPSGHVRAAHRIVYGGRIQAVFSGARLAVVVTSGLESAGPHGDAVMTWDLERDVFTTIARPAAPDVGLGRIGDTALFLGVYDAALEDDSGSERMGGLSFARGEPEPWSPREGPERFRGYGLVCPSGATFCTAGAFDYGEGPLHGALPGITARVLVTLDERERPVTRALPGDEGFVVFGGGRLAMPSELAWSNATAPPTLRSLPDLEPVEIPGVASDELYVAAGGTRNELHVSSASGHRTLELPAMVWHDGNWTAPEERVVPDVGAYSLFRLRFSPVAAAFAIESQRVFAVLDASGASISPEASRLYDSLDWTSSGAALRVGHAHARWLAEQVGHAPPVGGSYSTEPTEADYALRDAIADATDPASEGAPEWPTLPPYCVEAASICFELRATPLAWRIYDPNAPRRRARTVECDDVLYLRVPGADSVELAPGSHWIRFSVQDRAEYIMSTDRRELHEPTSVAVFETGWVLFDEDAHELVGLPFDGSDPVRRSYEGYPSVHWLDGTHAVIMHDDIAEIALVPSLEVVRTVALGSGMARAWECAGPDVVDPSVALEDRTPESIRSGACPRVVAEGERPVVVSADGAFFADLRTIPYAEVARSGDGAAIRVMLTNVGTLVTAAGGVFEAFGEIGDHVVVREPGPMTSAPLVWGADVRARFERPGLLAAFFSGAPLPAP